MEGRGCEITSGVDKGTYALSDYQKNKVAYGRRGEREHFGAACLPTSDHKVRRLC